MDIKALDKALQEIVQRRNALQQIDYNNPQYDDLEEELHDLEDAFQVKFGEALEEILQDIHDEHCPDTDVLYPIAYLAKSYTISDQNEYSVAPGEGVFVEVDEFPGKDTKLVILPNPPRVVLSVGKEQKVVWTAK